MRVPRGGASKDSGVDDDAVPAVAAIFRFFSVDISSETFEIRPAGRRYYTGYAAPRRVFSDPPKHELE